MSFLVFVLDNKIGIMLMERENTLMRLGNIPSLLGNIPNLPRLGNIPDLYLLTVLTF